MGEHHWIFQALLRSYFVLASSLVTNHVLLCSFCPSIYFAYGVEVTHELGFLFLKKGLVYWENLVTLLCDHILAGCLLMSPIHPQYK